MNIEPPLDQVDMHLLVIALHTIRYAKARKAHEESKSDPTKNVATGQEAYATEASLKNALDFFARIPGFYDVEAEKRLALRIESVPAIEIPG